MVIDFILLTVVITVLVVGVSWYIHLLRRKRFLNDLVFAPPTTHSERRSVMATALAVFLIITVTAVVTAFLVGGTK